MASIEQDDMFIVQGDGDDMMDEQDEMEQPSSQVQQEQADEDEDVNMDENDDNDDNDDQDEDEDEEEDEEEEEEEESEEESEEEGQEAGDDSKEENKDEEGKDESATEEISAESENGASKNGNSNGSSHATASGSNGSTVVPPTSPKYSPEYSADTFREQTINKARLCTVFDITPSVALPHSTQCHTFAFSEGPKWIVTGGEDGYIRKYDYIASIQGKSPLTMAQKHNLVDSVTKAGVIVSYWENEQPLTKTELMQSNPKLKPSDFVTGSVGYEPKPNPVYALDVHKRGLWCISGLQSGGISLYTMIYNEGAIHHYFKDAKHSKNGHSDTVSVLKLNQAQDKFISGSWDKTIREWDLNTGKMTQLYDRCTGQMSNIEFRPIGLGDMEIFEEDDQKEESDVDSLFGDSDAEQKEPPEKTKPTPKFNKKIRNDQVFMSSSIDGTVNIWDVRLASPVIRFGITEGVPPWCMSSMWSNNGELIYVGRRNSIVEEFSVRMPHSQNNQGMKIPNVSKVLSFPKISGPVSALATMPNSDFILCGSNDNIRLYNLGLYDELVVNSKNVSASFKKQATPFLIIPGHQGGILSALHVDETGRFMVSASGNRGWGHASHTDSVLIYEINFEG